MYYFQQKKASPLYNMSRYLLSFMAKDSTDEARFFAFDDEATKMIQKDCQALINPLYAKGYITSGTTEHTQQEIYLIG